MVSRLGDGILLGMGTEAVIQLSAAVRQPGTTGASPLETVSSAAGSAVVARRYDPEVAHDDGAHLALDAVAPERDHLSQFHKIGVPAGPGHLGSRSLQPLGDLAPEVLLGAVVGEADVGQPASGQELLALRVPTGQLLPFQLEKPPERDGIAFAAPGADALMPNFSLRLDRHEVEIGLP